MFKKLKKLYQKAVTNFTLLVRAFIKISTVILSAIMVVNLIQTTLTGNVIQIILSSVATLLIIKLNSEV